MMRSISIMLDSNDAFTSPADRFAAALAMEIPPSAELAALYAAREIHDGISQRAGSDYAKAHAPAKAKYDLAITAVRGKLQAAQAAYAKVAADPVKSIKAQEELQRAQQTAATDQQTIAAEFNDAIAEANSIRETTTRAATENYVRECERIGQAIVKAAIDRINARRV